MRTYNIYLLYPEEFNHQAVGIISQYNFAPTELSSGGIQEEDPSVVVPVLVMRDITGHLEGVKVRTLRFVGTEEEFIYQCFTELLKNKEIYEARTHVANPYGDGHACERIANILEGK